MELEAPLDAFAREQQAGLGALARLSRPGDRELPEGGAANPPWDPREPGDWDPPLAPRWADGDLPYADEPDIPDVSQRSPGRWR
jgi:hypothetical protein